MVTLTRRGVIGSAITTAIGGAALANTVHSQGSASAHSQFPAGFLWGVATAGHQVEGQNTNSDIWLLEHTRPSIYKESSGDACDSFNRWEQDLDIVRHLGLNTYRFSLEWSRIEPAEGEFSTVMLDHYKRVIVGCRDRGITPVVTFNHFTVPIWFAARGGWEVSGSADRFARYCERAARHLAAEIGFATTLNEPNILDALKWLPLPFPAELSRIQAEMLADAAKACGSKLFSSANAGNPDALRPNLLAGHKAGYQAIKSANPALPVGVSLTIGDDQAVGSTVHRELKREAVYGPWLRLISEFGDFIGVQNYSRYRLNGTGVMPPPAGAELTQMGEEFYPASVEGAVRFAHAATGKPVLISENGIATTDDSRRVAYIPQAIAGVRRAITDGVPILGYIHWSLLDNYEWLFGYEPRFGLVAVDRQTFERRPKPSAYVYGKIARGRLLV